ncbi:hypothetical protein E1292_46735 [Nonomuraea deserti]|uniref:Arabinan endo-1,5-alpha-L-arabinosidase n=1 Tax=Nonomuraea deserti TaxID=1848322 RepID=A0A4V2Y6A3_9ACTN|nr:family 43 glycosylhydrolase [Nonomuraea deserti]TDC87395.1 hypothetical protein E1292_46735 [Nonomuraea deserti]
MTLFIAVAITSDLGGSRGPEPSAYMFAAGLGLLMLVRRRHPVLALVATGVGILGYHAVGYPLSGSPCRSPPRSTRRPSTAGPGSPWESPSRCSPSPTPSACARARSSAIWSATNRRGAWRSWRRRSLSATTCATGGAGRPHPEDTTRYHLATRPDLPYAVEASDIVKRGRYHYLFASYDGCCAGVDSTYKIRFGRSTSPTGPYADRAGVPMLYGGGTLLLETHGRHIGPGGAEHHARQGRRRARLPVLRRRGQRHPETRLNRLGSDREGWPYVR